MAPSLVARKDRPIVKPPNANAAWKAKKINLCWRTFKVWGCMWWVKLNALYWVPAYSSIWTTFYNTATSYKIWRMPHWNIDKPFFERCIAPTCEPLWMIKFKTCFCCCFLSNCSETTSWTNNLRPPLNPRQCSSSDVERWWPWLHSLTKDLRFSWFVWTGDKTIHPRLSIMHFSMSKWRK